MHSHKHTCMHLSTPHPIITPLLQYQTSNSNTNKHNLSLLLGNMPVNPISQEHSQIWPWEAAMYANLHYHHEAAYHYEKEHMFEKPLTPSDVGKLNRLVIPKQHAERYFPLGGDSSEKGLLLSFEDEAGKPWRFRYSYWTSSQSYVLTKGWSRYVKEKRLDAGDVVLFERVRGGSSGDRLFIGCRRRGAAHESAQIPTPRAAAAHNAVEQPWSPMCYSSPGSYPTSPAANSYLYLGSVQQDHGSLLHAGDQRDGDVRSSSVATPAPTSSRRLRLFGVNLDCGPELPEPEETAASMYSVMHQTPCTPMSSLSNYWTSS